VEARHGALRRAAPYLQERGRCDDEGLSARGTRPATGIARSRPLEKLSPEHQERRAALEDERAVGKLRERRSVQTVPARGRVDPLDMELRVDRVRARGTGVKLAPDLGEADVVLASAQRARPVPGGEGGRLVEEEELRELAGLQEGAAVPPAEREPAGDPALPVVAAADATRVVVQAPAVP
jgi:hypothetical protein